MLQNLPVPLVGEQWPSAMGCLAVGEAGALQSSWPAAGADMVNDGGPHSPTTDDEQLVLYRR